MRCPLKLNISVVLNVTQHEKWVGGQEVGFVLGKILVYPDKSYLLFIKPNYQQVPGGGGSEGYHL